MIAGWISLRVKDPKQVGNWYEQLGLDVIGRRSDIGSVVVGTKDHGRAIVLIPGEPLEHPERLQIHLAVPDVDTAYQRLVSKGIEFKQGPKDMPWRWRHAYTSDPAGHTVEICSPLPDAKDLDSTLLH
jgi:catechol 2,3-dioxygenase-like lactoylglutathione lyase family enzyme